MLIDALTNALEKSKCLENFWGKLSVGTDASLGVASSARSFLASAEFARYEQPTLVVLAGEDAADAFARNMASYLGEERVFRFPERRDRPHLYEATEPKVIATRLEAMDVLNRKENAVVVASARSLIKLLPPVSAHVEKPISLTSGYELSDMKDSNIKDFEELLCTLESYGYKNTGEVEGPGTFATKGGTIDVFPGNLSFPVRLDFFGDELDEIRRIIPSTGQTVSGLKELNIYAVREVPAGQSEMKQASSAIEKAALTNKTIRELYEKVSSGISFDGSDLVLPYIFNGKTSTLGDYLSAGSMIALMEPRSIFDDAANAFNDLEKSCDDNSIPIENVYARPTDISFGEGVRATYVSIMQSGTALDDELPIKRVDVSGDQEKLYGKMRNWIDGGYTCVFSVPNYRARKDYELEFVDHGISIEERLDSQDENTAPLSKSCVNVVDVPIPLGMCIPKAKLTIVSVDDTRGSSKNHARATTVSSVDITFPFKPGDYVVHSTYGIALFKDMVLREIDGVERDYLELDYAEGDKLFLPVEQFDKVTKYVGADGVTPKITRLDSTDWSRAITKARKATKKLAFDLIDVYARRAATKGYRFRVDTPWMHEMEQSFPYDETPDQAAAIADVKADMRSSHPMDRLICGDVGFGKTEVALRAAFAAAQDGKQTMVLCPTTILAQQHYSSFKERFEPFGMRVEVLSRFRTTSQQKDALEGFAKGEVNVLVGTHRLLSRDVNPKNLGLVIIDEEQRFGVGHKEQFKNLRESIDVLTLSATPIPRTMQMAVSGVRDMSLIMTPPDDRLPVKVHVGEWDPDVVSDAIRYELARHGQVYYVSNRVRTIEDALERVQEAAPEARVGVAHGQMSKEALEHVMEDFAAGELDVLVATTIIESGIDNPHTNTLIIEDSQRLGLAQMYQLKGRVGRSSTQAFAYFMFPEEVPLTEEAHSRLVALTDHQDLGSGMRIALRDLEIRGAGNILGAEQSGNMSGVGFDLFAQMLNQAVVDAREGVETKDEPIKGLSDININIPGHTYLSADYLKDIGERVLWYRRIANAATVGEVDAIESDLKALHPEMPIEAMSLFDKARLKAFASEHGISSISVFGGKLTVDGIKLDSANASSIRRLKGRYLKDKMRMIVPMKAVEEAAGKDLSATQMVMSYLSSFYNVTNDTKGKV